MKNTLLGLVAATLVATPALAASWKSDLFAHLDADKSGELSITELEQTGCRVNVKLFGYADSDSNKALSKNEFFANRVLFSRCK